MSKRIDRPRLVLRGLAPLAVLGCLAAACSADSGDSALNTVSVVQPESQVSLSDIYLVGEYDPTRDPQEDLAHALSVAGVARTGVILVVGGDWCPDCHHLDTFLAENEDIARELAARFELVKVNISEENYNDSFLTMYPTFDWVPHFYILNESGEMIDSYDTRGLMEDAQFSHESFEAFLDAYT